MATENYMSMREVAQRLGVGKSSVWRKTVTGELKFKRFGQSKLILWSDVEKTLNSPEVVKIHKAALKVGGVLLALSFLMPSARAEQNDIAIAIKVAREYELDSWQTQALMCVRVAENGREGREYGVLTPQAMNRFDDGSQLIQARWAAGTIKKRLPNSTHIKEFASRWCPIGAKNDPNNLNKHWVGNFENCLTAIGG